MESQAHGPLIIFSSYEGREKLACTLVYDTWTEGCFGVFQPSDGLQNLSKNYLFIMIYE